MLLEPVHFFLGPHPYTFNFKTFPLDVFSVSQPLQSMLRSAYQEALERRKRGSLFLGLWVVVGVSHCPSAHRIGTNVEVIIQGFLSRKIHSIEVEDLAWMSQEVGKWLENRRGCWLITQHRAFAGQQPVFVKVGTVHWGYITMPF